jgi:hypothetical protein
MDGMRALVLLLVVCAPLAACGLTAESLVRGQLQRGGGPCRGEMSRIREQNGAPHDTRLRSRGDVHTVEWDYDRPQDLVVHFTWTEQSGGCSVFVESA